MKVNNFDEWKKAVSAEVSKLTEVWHYLNDNGVERRNVFITLSSLSSFCTSAKELVDWLQTQEEFTKHDIEYINSRHAAAPIKALKRIAESE